MHPRSTSIVAAELSRQEEVVALHAQETADLVAAFLKSVGVKGKVRKGKVHKPVELPAALLLALGGLLRLQRWQQAGLGPLLGEGLPDATCTLERIRDEIVQHGASQVAPAPQSFWFTWTFHAWHRAFCHAASGKVECDLLVLAEPNDNAISCIANWLWQQRHSSLGDITNDDSNT